ncbi:hypothetical protein [Natrinema hispanicum]|uniref:Uncharacterized protein n=1 Tax=Natrinema hispanicum TaxID=392421 RepID=A0A1G6VNF5_9EURY|nr:hypothetical protein [Natrinema hispanicum]SDD54943.1 hypothetical protein SAMN05192552_10306 [Natrinema hispanicum]
MSNLSIPFGLDPEGTKTPIEEAQRKTDYYRCPECGEFLTPRIGSQRQYFAHKQGVLENISCSLSSDEGVERMIEDLRTSDIEEGERKRSIRTYLGQRHDGGIELFGIVPSLDWGQLQGDEDVDALLKKVEIEATGITHPPVPSNFHPSEAEVTLDLDPTANSYRLQITGPDALGSITGTWTASGLQHGDLFVGDETRAQRYKSDRQVRKNMWVYLVSENPLQSEASFVDVYDFADVSLIGFRASEKTEPFLDRYGEGLSTENYGFDADVVLPAYANPTVEAPLYAPPEEPVLVGVTPSEEIDPIFEVVSIPKDANDTVEINRTGPGNPRYYTTEVPADGSRRVSIHQRNSDRHRLIHLHPSEESTAIDTPSLESRRIGIEIKHEDDRELLSPIGEPTSKRMPADFNPHLLHTDLDYVGPDGLELEIIATFAEDAPLGPTITRDMSEFNNIISEIVHWVESGCIELEIRFNGIGTVSVVFPQPSYSEANDNGIVSEDMR